MKPILFNTEMVRAILDDRKTVTRRLLKQPFEVHPNGYITKPKGNERLCPYEPPHQKGDILYVRETWRCYRYDNMDGNFPFGVQYKVDGEKNYFEMDDSERYEKFENLAIKDTWQPSLYMPKEAARIFLKVTNVKAERLSDMKVEDMISEGINMDGLITSSGIIEYRVINRWEELWDSTIKKEDMNKYGHDANPMVWVIEFERISKEDTYEKE